MTASDKRGTLPHSAPPVNNPAALLAAARAQAAALSAANTSQSTPVAPALQSNVAQRTPKEILLDLVNNSVNVKPLASELERRSSTVGEVDMRRSRELMVEGTPFRLTKENKEAKRDPTFNKRYSPGIGDVTLLQIRKEVAKTDALAQILANVEEYPELGAELEARRELVKVEMEETGQAVLRELRNRYEWVYWGSRWEIANLVQHAFPNNTSLDAAEQTLAFLETSNYETIKRVVSILKGYASEITPNDERIEASFELLCRLAKINEVVTDTTPRQGLDKEKERDWSAKGSWRSGFRRGPPEAPFYELLSKKLKPEDWTTLVDRFDPPLRDWFNGKGGQRAAAYDVEANPMHIWHWNEEHSPLTEFSNACFGSTPEGHSILIKRARDGAVEGPYYRYTVDANNCQVGSTVKGGPRIFLDAIKELSDDGKIPLFAYSTSFIDELVLIAAAWHAGGLIMDGEVVQEVPDTGAFKNQNGAFVLNYKLDGEEHSVTLLNIGRIIVAANKKYLKQKWCGATTFFSYRLSLPDEEDRKIPGVVEQTIKIADFSKALPKRPNPKEAKCSLDIYYELMITHEFKGMYQYYSSQTADDSSSSPPPPKRRRIASPESSPDTSEIGSTNRSQEAQELGGSQSGEEDELVDDVDEVDDGTIDEAKWKELEGRWATLINRLMDWIDRGEPGTRSGV